MTGGLGPTKDDITKETLCRMFGSELYENAEALANIERIFAQRGFPMTETNRRQAWVPRCCEMINNDLGTAPCMWFEMSSHKTKVMVSLPGVPFEMEYLLDKKILPLVRERFQLGSIVCKNLLVQGIGESFLSDRLEAVEASLPPHIKLAYLPQAGMIKLRITATSDTISDILQAEVEKISEKIRMVASEFIVGEDHESLAEEVAFLLRKKRLTLSAAESCTGGQIAAQLTALAGASEYFKGGIVSYCNEVKADIVGVEQATLDSHTAVSEATVREMAEGARRRLNTDYAVATTGVAGPTGGSDLNPVGTVWMAVATPEKTVTKKMRYNGRRQQVIDRTVNEVFAMLIREVSVQ
jgi:nicotinamide-nucleotide amidase